MISTNHFFVASFAKLLNAGVHFRIGCIENDSTGNWLRILSCDFVRIALRKGITAFPTALIYLNNMA